MNWRLYKDLPEYGSQEKIAYNTEYNITAHLKSSMDSKSVEASSCKY